MCRNEILSLAHTQNTITAAYINNSIRIIRRKLNKYKLNVNIPRILSVLCFFNNKILFHYSLSLTGPFDHGKECARHTRCSRSFLVYFFISFAGFSYGRFITIRYKFKWSTYVQEPLLIGSLVGAVYRERLK